MTTGAAATPADVGREAVYAAEEAAFGGTDLDRPVTLDALQALAAGVVASDWWAACGALAVDVVGARSDAASSSARAGGTGVLVRLASSQRTGGTVTHELAHALAGIGHGHDGRFRAAHVDVVAMLAGRGAASALARAYVDHDVAPGRRSWPPPERGRGPGFVIVP